MRLSEHYDRKYEAPSALPEPIALVGSPTDRFQMLVKIASQCPGERYLEIGAGNGATTLTLEPFFDALVATELSGGRAKHLERLFADHPKVRVECSNIESGLSYADDSFDTIAVSAVIEHLVDPIRALAELRRVVRPGGRVLIDTPNIAKWTRRAKLALGYFPSTASFDEGLLQYDRKTPTDLHDEGHFHYFTFRSLRRICLERAGFSRVRQLGYGRTSLSRRWPTLFSDVFLVAEK